MTDDNEAGDDTAGLPRDGEPSRLPAPATDVELWVAALARPRAEIDRLAALLSPAEIARAARFGRPDLRDRYIVGRATLRIVLAQRLGGSAAAVAIARGVRGRPFAAEGNGLDFNVSHTRGVLLVGITAHQRIGVDIEHRERALNVEGVARKFMSPREQQALATFAPDARRRALLRLWTCKEAMSKATGDALSAPFSRMDITVDPSPRLEDGPAPYTPGAWRLLPAAVPGGYLATVALWHGP